MLSTYVHESNWWIVRYLANILNKFFKEPSMLPQNQNRKTFAELCNIPTHELNNIQGRRITAAEFNDRTHIEAWVNNLFPANDQEFLLMHFGARPQIDHDTLMRNYPTFDSLVTRMDIVETMDLETVRAFEQEWMAFKDYCISELRRYTRGFIWPPPQHFEKEFAKIAAHKQKLLLSDHAAARYINNPVVMSEKEWVNGYQLYEGIMKVDYDDFMNLVAKCLMVQPTEEEFAEYLDNNLCSDWAKMDEHGECYGGFWNAEEGSYEKENAYTLSQQANIYALKALPFPREFIKWTIELGCSNRQESVRYSNCWGVWIDKNIKNQMLSLTDMIKYKLNCEHKPLPAFF